MKFHKSSELPSRDVLEKIVACMDMFMRKSPVDRWQEKFSSRSNYLIQWVDDGSKVVAFKAGYELRPGLFYSWLGGVLPEYRRQGVAKRLLKEQHEYAKTLGCTAIRTISTNDHKNMMICNLNAGFDIVETKTKDGEVRIIMSKTIV